MSDEASDPLNITEKTHQRVQANVKNVDEAILPTMVIIFKESQHEVEQLVSFDIYPRFVKHQMALSARKALTSARGKYAGLGDCFCLSDPS